MALIKLGALAQDVRGSLNGSVFSRNRGGAYVRSKVSPLQPVSEWSSAVRAVFKALAQRWSSVLEPGQRSGWEAFAAVHPFVNVFGDQVLLSGIAMYESCNMATVLCAEDAIDDAPLMFSIEDLGTLNLTATVTGNVPTLGVGIGRVLTGEEAGYVFATPPLSGGRSVQRSDLRLISVPPYFQDHAPFVLGPALVKRFPDVVWDVGQRIGLLIGAFNFKTGCQLVGVSREVTFAAPGP